MSSPRTVPATYWPRTTSRRTSSGVRRRTASSTLAFSVRTASAAKQVGGSIAVRVRSWNRWFGTMSRNAPVWS